MIAVASKYSSVPQRAKPMRVKARVRADEQAAQVAARLQQKSFPHVFIPVFGSVNMRDWFWRESREGGLVHTYLRRIGAQQRDRLRACAARLHNHQQNPRSDMQKRASIPLYDYLSAPQATGDPHFWDDLNAGLKWLAKDSPEWRDVVKRS